MKTPEEILYALSKCCGSTVCGDCPYVRITMCRTVMHSDARELIISLTTRYKPASEASQEPVEAPEPWTMEKVLAEAKRFVCGERDQSYGDPEDSFRMISNLWTAYHGVEFTPVDVSIMMGLLKVARLASNPQHMDSWVDLAGYAACGGEIAGKEAGQ